MASHRLQILANLLAEAQGELFPRPNYWALNAVPRVGAASNVPDGPHSQAYYDPESPDWEEVIPADIWRITPKDTKDKLRNFQLPKGVPPEIMWNVHMRMKRFPEVDLPREFELYRLVGFTGGVK